MIAATIMAVAGFLASAVPVQPIAAAAPSVQCRVPDPVPAFKADHVILDSLRIHSKLWRIVEADLGQSNCAGYTEAATHTIYIDRNMVEAERPELVLHEVMHAAVGGVFSNRVDTGHNFIYTLSPPLQRILADNPTLVAYLARKGQ